MTMDEEESTRVALDRIRRLLELPPGSPPSSIASSVAILVAGTKAADEARCILLRRAIAACRGGDVSDVDIPDSALEDTLFSSLRALRTEASEARQETLSRVAAILSDTLAQYRKRRDEAIRALAGTRTALQGLEAEAQRLSQETALLSDLADQIAGKEMR